MVNLNFNFSWPGKHPSSHLKVTKMWFGPNIKYLPEPFFANFCCREGMSYFDSENKNTSTNILISLTRTNLLLNEFMFKWPIIVLFALSNLCFFILWMSLEEKLSPVTKGELSLTLSSYFCQPKFVKTALKFLTNTEIPASFRSVLLFKCLFVFTLLLVFTMWVIVTIFFRHIFLLHERLPRQLFLWSCPHDKLYKK